MTGLIAGALVTACAATQPVAEWRDQAWTGGPLDNILIIGVSDRPAVRRSFEDSFAAKLEKEGVRGVSSAAVMPADAEVDRDSLRPVVEANGIDAVLVTHLLGVEQGEVYHPPSYSIAPYYGGLYGYHGRVRGYMYEPGYYTRYQKVRLETNLYDATTEKLVWSMQTESLDPSSEQKLIDEKIEIVVKRLAEQGLL